MLLFTCARYDIPLRIRPEEIAAFQSNFKNERTILLKCGARYEVLDSVQLIDKKISEYRMGLERENQDLRQQLKGKKNA